MMSVHAACMQTVTTTASWFLQQPCRHDVSKSKIQDRMLPSSTCGNLAPQQATACCRLRHKRCWLAPFRTGDEHGVSARCSACSPRAWQISGLRTSRNRLEMEKSILRFFQKVGSAGTPLQQTVSSEQAKQQLLPSHSRADQVRNAPTASFKVRQRMHAFTSIMTCSQSFLRTRI